MFVDNRGNPNYVYWPFDETTWDGLSTADLVFPWFLLIMGTAIAIALSKNEYSASAGACRDGAVWYRVIRRFVVLFLLGVFFNAQALKFGAHFRIMGVLQRLGLCYAVCASLFLTVPRAVQRGAVACMAATYVGLMYGLRVPGCGRGRLTPSCNAGAYVDQRVFTRHYMIYPNDPEGLVSSLTACLTTYLGVELGRAFVQATRQSEQAAASLPGSRPALDALALARLRHRSIMLPWLGISLSCLVLALVLLPVIPFNKKIYTLSFAFFTVASGGLMLLLLYVLFDALGTSAGGLLLRKCAQPLLWIGSNPLAIFLTMLEVEILAMDNITVPCGAARQCSGSRTSLWNWLYWRAFQSWLHDLYFASFVFSFAVLLLFVLMAYVMHRNKIVFKL